MDAGACRELTITFDVEGNWSMPFAIDYSPAENSLIKALLDVIRTHRSEP
ncbi:hypothetical protein [Lentzea sp. NBRC 102530]|nr:hypothetical protein [Lentzea sp. NBRC 102530]